MVSTKTSVCWVNYETIRTFYVGAGRKTQLEKYYILYRSASATPIRFCVDVVWKGEAVKRANYVNAWEEIIYEFIIAAERESFPLMIPDVDL